VLTLRRSILTEKVARRGYHLSREYSIDPLEIVFASEVVRTGVAALPADATPHGVASLLGSKSAKHEQRLFPVVDDDRRLVGVITRGGLREWIERNRNGDRQQPLGDAIHHDPVVAFGDEPLRLIVYRMADKGVTRLPVVSGADRTLIGMLALTDLLGARARILNAERRRERVLGTRLRLPTMFGGRSDSAA
jgi:chloride channel protein, CIC family